MKLEQLPPGSMVFCDFDGTITERDTLQAIAETFAPEAAARLLPAIGEGRLSLRLGVAELIASLRSADVGKIVEFVRRQPLRRGFEDFAQRLHAAGVPLIVLSGGIGFCVEASLEPWRELIRAVRAVEVDLSGEFMRAQVPDSGDEALPKAAIMAGYQPLFSVAIGDSMSDFGIARAAGLVYARGRLLDFMHEQGFPVRAYRDFDDIPVNASKFDWLHNASSHCSVCHLPRLGDETLQGDES